VENSRVFAVFGKPVLHSKSPQLFNSAFTALNMRGFYTRVLPRSAGDMIELIRKLPMQGANITAPYKEDAIPLLDELSADAKAIGAVNTILNQDGHLTGHNTDHIGVTGSLSESGFQVHGKKCLVLGAGGAARAVAYALVNHGAQVSICNRTPSRAEAIASDLGCEITPWNKIPDKEHFDLLVSTLPGDVLPSFFDWISFGLLLDANYKPSEISAKARMKGIQVVGGERWLLHQALGALKLFSGSTVSRKIMEDGLKDELIKEELKIIFIENDGVGRIFTERPDLIVSAGKLSSTEKKQIVDEEIDQAFGG
jgi:shikimate dehydrogenase